MTGLEPPVPLAGGKTKSGFGHEKAQKAQGGMVGEGGAEEGNRVCTEDRQDREGTREGAGSTISEWASPDNSDTR